MIYQRTAVVTGGGSGIGEAACYELARRGYTIAVFDIDPQAAERVAATVRTHRSTAVAFEVNVTDRPALQHAFACVRSELGPVTALVTSAGKVGFGRFEDLSVQSWSDMLDVNLTGTFHCCQLALSDMLAARWGRIVTISSSSAQRGAPRMAHYAVAKGAVLTLTKCLAAEYAGKHITVNAISPSSIDTPMARQSHAAGTLGSPEALATLNPMGRLGTCEETAAAVGFLCSEDAGFITGQVLGVNGGAVMS